MLEDGFFSYTAQATLELMAANYYSNQMTVVVLTDLSSGATIFTLRAEEGMLPSIVLYEKASLEQAAKFIADHLTEACVPIKNHSLDSGTKSADDFANLQEIKSDAIGGFCRVGTVPRDAAGLPSRDQGPCRDYQPTLSLL